MATFEWDRNTSPELQHVVVKDVTNNEAAAVIIDATFNDNAIKIPLMHQIINTYGISVKDTKTLLYSATEHIVGVTICLCITVSIDLVCTNATHLTRPNITIRKNIYDHFSFWSHYMKYEI